MADRGGEPLGYHSVAEELQVFDAVEDVLVGCSRSVPEVSIPGTDGDWAMRGEDPEWTVGEAADKLIYSFEGSNGEPELVRADENGDAFRRDAVGYDGEAGRADFNVKRNVEGCGYDGIAGGYSHGVAGGATVPDMATEVVLNAYEGVVGCHGRVIAVADSL